MDAGPWPPSPLYGRRTAFEKPVQQFSNAGCGWSRASRPVRFLEDFINGEGLHLPAIKGGEPLFGLLSPDFIDAGVGRVEAREEGLDTVNRPESLRSY
jgi:hypothetical protein